MKNLLDYERIEDQKAQRKPIVCDLEFISDKNEHYYITVYDDGRYCISYPSLRSDKPIANIKFGDPEFNEIDSRFEEWLLAKVYPLV